MKTAKLFLSILGVTLATLSFGQLMSLHETSKTDDLNMVSFIESENEVLFYTADYNADNGRTIYWVNHKPLNNYPSATFDAPLVSRTYFARNVKAMYEEIPVVEAWMIIPFQSSFNDSELWVEDWMISPFDSEFGEEAMEIEPWMTSEWI